MYNIEEYKNIISARLSPYRYNHSLCVSESAVKLAKRYGADIEKAEVAGLLHDITKEDTPQNQLEYIKQAGYKQAEYEVGKDKFYHQLSGAAYCKIKLGIDDEEILNAIKYHTTGKADMSLLEQIIYLADFISADRQYNKIEEMRLQAEKSKEDGMLYAMKYTIKSNIKKERFVHPQTVFAYNWLLDEMGGDKDE